MTPTTKADEGWFWPDPATKAHYFRAGRSLCRRWGFPGPLTPDNGKPSRDDCTTCRKALDREATR